MWILCVLRLLDGLVREKCLFSATRRLFLMHGVGLGFLWVLTARFLRLKIVLFVMLY